MLISSGVLMLFNRNSSGYVFMSGILQGYGKTLVLDRGVTSFKWNSPILCMGLEKVTDYICSKFSLVGFFTIIVKMFKRKASPLLLMQEVKSGLISSLFYKSLK